MPTKKELERTKTAHALIEGMMPTIEIDIDSINDKETLADAVNKVGIMMKASKELEDMRKKTADVVIKKMQEFGITMTEDMQIIEVAGQTRIDPAKVKNYFAEQKIDINLVNSSGKGYKYLSELRDKNFQSD